MVVDRYRVGVDHDEQGLAHLLALHSDPMGQVVKHCTCNQEYQCPIFLQGGACECTWREPPPQESECSECWYHLQIQHNTQCYSVPPKQEHDPQGAKASCR